MDVVICGAGEVGHHAAEVLAADGHNITLIDLAPEKLAAAEESLDVHTLTGNGAHADVLREAGVHSAQLFIAATNVDEINLLTAALAKSVGVRRCGARVHHSAYFEQRGLDYAHQLNIDHLVCPEYTTAVAIAQTLRNPGAMAVERFARGRIEMQQFQVSRDAKVVDRRLADLDLPGGSRLASIGRNGTFFIPTADTIVRAEDIVTLVGDVKHFDQAHRFFLGKKMRRRIVTIIGGTAMGVWLCRALHSNNFAVKIVVADPARAEELSNKLDWVTVFCADPGEQSIYDEEQIHQTDVFVALSDEDERNILAAARAKSLGAKSAIAVLQQSTYLHLLEHVGIDRAFSPRVTAVAQLRHWLQDGPVRHLASLATDVADIYEVHLDAGAKVVDHTLREIIFPEPIIVTAIEREGDVFVPGASDTFQAGDTVVVAGRTNLHKVLRKTFGV
ncbi:MAG: Trk system potassium transporter TrkA [Phycisphaerales bacterium]|nr:Trk system potassium transporter TrkA [Phycisphaerales bacterium]